VLAGFTPLKPLPAPRVVNSAQPYPGGSYDVRRTLDGDRRTEYASNGNGTNTFVEVQFPGQVRIGAFRHVDRNDPAIVGQSELVFSDADGRVTGTVSVPHANRRAGETFFVLPTPMSGERIKWRVTGLGQQGLTTVGAAELEFFAQGESEAVSAQEQLEMRPLPFLEKNGADGVQPVKISVTHLYVEPVEAVLHVQGSDPIQLHLKPGVNANQIDLPAVETETVQPVSLETGGQTVASVQLSRKPVRPLTIFILPHSHTDIGYTEIQTAIEKKQVQNLIDGMAHARRTATYPEGARFVWNVEVLWAADLYLHRLNEQQRADFSQAVRRGQVVLCGMYLNELTGLCRPEELVQLFRYATKLGQQTGKPIDSAMISDVPGYTWGTVTAMAHAGIRYFSAAPNYFDRIGTILREWENKPFWWVGPNGQDKVLVWIPFWGYAMSHVYSQMTPQLVEDFYAGLENKSYPYDVAYVRWSGHGDNAVPDPAICDFVREWNEKHVWPHFIISGTSRAFAALEKRYGDQLPLVRGDWTPYWEDGAGSSARETSLNRQSADRLVQAEALFAMAHEKSYPAEAFNEAWKNVLLYSEHTWGADCSISQPESQKTREQWAIKQGYAQTADKQSRELFTQALSKETPPAGQASTLQLLNTASWPRKELVLVPSELSRGGDVVVDTSGTPLPSQRLADGQLAFLSRNVPPFCARPISIAAGQPQPGMGASAHGTGLDNGLLRVRMDERTGGIAELTVQGLPGNLVDTKTGETLNEYLYLPGDDLNNLQRNGPVTIRVGEPGPLVASLVVQSDAPGCNQLHREIRLVAGLDYVEIINVVDKKRLAARDYHAKEGKESVNFAFPFQIPDGQVWLDLPLGFIRPEAEQMPSACKNWFTIGRWADVANVEYGVTWVTLDAPLVEIGGITANLLNSQTNPEVWRSKVERTQKLYSWAMNNHWGTNYRAYQEGPTTFRFILRPHRRLDLAEASRFSVAFSQPLLVTAAPSPAMPSKPMLSVQPADVLVTACKPADEGQGMILRLFNAAREPKVATLAWGQRQPKTVRLSDTSEKAGRSISGGVELPGEGLVSLRVDF
jgi:hypothetical protein